MKSYLTMRLQLSIVLAGITLLGSSAGMAGVNACSNASILLQNSTSQTYYYYVEQENGQLNGAPLGSSSNLQSITSHQSITFNAPDPGSQGNIYIFAAPSGNTDSAGTGYYVFNNLVTACDNNGSKAMSEVGGPIILQYWEANPGWHQITFSITNN